MPIEELEMTQTVNLRIATSVGVKRERQLET